MLAPEVHPAPKSTKHHGRAQVVSGGSARKTQILFFTEAEAREWATTGKPAPPAVGAQPGPVQLHKPPADSLTDAWSTPAPEPLADARSLTPARAPAADPGGPTGHATPPPTAPGDDDQAVGLREAAEHHLPGITLAALRFARANDPAFPRATSAASNSSTASATSRSGPATGPAPPPALPTWTDGGTRRVGNLTRRPPIRTCPLSPTRPLALENTRITRPRTEEEGQHLATPRLALRPRAEAEQAGRSQPRRPARRGARDADDLDDRHRRRHLAHRPGPRPELTRRRTRRGPRRITDIPGARKGFTLSNDRAPSVTRVPAAASSARSPPAFRTCPSPGCRAIGPPAPHAGASLLISAIRERPCGRVATVGG
ncbi:hypothetical protein GA0115252_107210 [Streptomyces sp. DfronAA-171]|nr:hypothetical protein GA0115252_107210 [Streptomyces sp. DfronAA-171]